MKEKLYIANMKFANNKEYFKNGLLDIDNTFIQSDYRSKNIWVNSISTCRDVPLLTPEIINSDSCFTVNVESKIVDLLFSEDIEVFNLGNKLLKNIIDENNI